MRPCWRSSRPQPATSWPRKRPPAWAITWRCRSSGIDRSPDNGYFQAKIAQEKLIEAGPIPYSIVRATQFFEFIDGIADAATTGNEVHMAPVAFQPIAADDVARRGRRGRGESPGERASWKSPVPRSSGSTTSSGDACSARHDPRQVIADPHAPYFGAVPSEHSLVPLNGAQLGTIRFEDWLKHAPLPA